MFFPYFYLLMFYQCGTVFQTAFLTTCYNPETSSRVTLASLGIGFQPNLMVIGHLWIKQQYKKIEKNIFVCFYLLIFFQHDKTTRQQMRQNCLTIRILSTKKIKEKFANSDYYPYLCIRFSIGKQKERCSSGWRGTPGKRVYVKSVSGVRIPLSPHRIL